MANPGGAQSFDNTRDSARQSLRDFESQGESFNMKMSSDKAVASGRRIPTCRQWDLWPLIRLFKHLSH